MAYGDPVALLGDSSVFCLPCARTRYGVEQIDDFIKRDAVTSLAGRDGEPLSVAREGMHDRFVCGLACECGTSVCPYYEHDCKCSFAQETTQAIEDALSAIHAEQKPLNPQSVLAQVYADAPETDPEEVKRYMRSIYGWTM